MQLFCLADEDTVRGFRLAGVAGEAVADAPQAAAALERVRLQPDCAILIVTEAVAASIRPQVEALRWEHDRPLLVEIPGPGGPLPERKRLHQLVQEAVGIRVDP